MKATLEGYASGRSCSSAANDRMRILCGAGAGTAEFEVSDEIATDANPHFYGPREPCGLVYPCSERKQTRCESGLCGDELRRE